MNQNNLQTEKSRRQILIICAALVALVWAVFGQACSFDFVNYDDPVCVYQNPIITSGISWQSVVLAFTRGSFEAWYPLTDFTHQLDWELYGSEAGGHHLTNILLHAAATIVLFLTIRRLTGATWRAALVSALFAVHPLRAESVAWVVERKDVLSGLFFALTLWAWAGHVKTLTVKDITSPENAGLKSLYARFHPSVWYFLAVIFFTLGLLAKTILVTLPFVLLLLDFWPLQRLPSGSEFFSRRSFQAWLGLAVEKLPFLFVSAAFCAITLLTQRGVVSISHVHTIPWRIGNAVEACTTYLAHMAWPAGLTVVYAGNGITPTLFESAASAMLLIGISIAAILAARRRPWLLAGWLWYLVTLLPVIDFMQLSHNARADRYTYLPQIGVLLSCVWAAAEFRQSCRWRRTTAAALATAVLLALATAAYFQTSYWRNSETLWKRSLACNPENAFAWNYLGSALFNQGRHAEARHDYQEALKIQPDYPEALVNLGITSADLGNRTEAIALFRHVLQINQASAEAHYNLGDALAEEGRWDEAIEEFHAALHFRPDYPGAEYDLGLALARSGRWDEAAANYQQALRIPISAADTRYITGVDLAAHTNWDAAASLYEAALNVDANHAEAHYRLAVALAAMGKTQPALEHLQQAKTLATSQGKEYLLEGINEEIKKIADNSPR
jgi:tetratricopeptide (TPR) repeat protein